MTLSVLMYTMMVSTLVVLLGVLVVDVMRGFLRSRPAPPDRPSDVSSAGRRRSAQLVGPTAGSASRRFSADTKHAVHIAFTGW